MRRVAEMSIGEQIKKFRTEKSITQEQLGELVGVSTQAVSKWERGGAPDIELLPALSQALGVSIDALFGNDDRSETLKLAQKLSRMSDKEAYRYAFGICWALEVGLRRDSSVIEDFRPKTRITSISQSFSETAAFLPPAFLLISATSFLWWNRTAASKIN